MAAKKTSALLALVFLAAIIGSGAGIFAQRSEPVEARQSSALPPTQELARIEESKKDHEGLPLPPEAVARLGSARLRPGNMVLGLAWAADGKRIVSTAFGGPVQIWDAGTGKLQHTIADKVAYRSALVAPPIPGAAIHLFTGLAYRVLDPATGKELRRHDLKTVEAFRCALSPDGKALAVVQSDGTVRIIDLASGNARLVRQFEGSLFVAVAFAPSGKLLALGDNAGPVRLIDSATGEVVVTLKTPNEPVQHVAFAPDGKRLLTASAAGIVIWSLPAGKEQTRLNWPLSDRLVFCSAFSPDGKSVAIGSQWHYVPLFDTATGQETQRLVVNAMGLCMRFAPGSRRISRCN